MNILGSNYWTSFKKDNNGREVFDGELFEELIRLVLDTHFSGNWNQTTRTWDGGKDFVDRSITGLEAWAECKMYKAPLSIKVVSNTLVMAIGHHPKVKRLIIFSFSQLNENTRQHLSRFSESSNIEVQVFDDEKLEALILSSKLVLRRFFPAVQPIYKASELPALDIVPSFSTDVHIDRSQLEGIDGVDKFRKTLVPINTPCLYEIFIRSNQIAKSEKIVIDLSPFMESENAINLLNRNAINTDPNHCLHKELLPGELTSVKILLAPVSTRVQTIPSISYSIGKKTTALPPIQVNVPRLNRPSLVGKPVYDALEAFETRISGKNTITLAAVSGKSGVGKTRFLEEAEMRLLSNNYHVLRMDGRDHRCEVFNTFVIGLLAQIWRLPNINLFSSDTNTYTRSKNRDTLFDKVCYYVYQSQTEKNTLNEELEQILDLAIQGLISQRAALLIDNVQKLDHSTIHFLTKLSERITGTVGQVALLFAFNEDELIYSTDSALFRNKLQKEASFVKGSIQFFDLPQFSRNSVEMFLNTICGSMGLDEKFTTHYPALTDLIYESVLPRPLDLYQLFLAAQDEQIARVDDGFFFVKDTEVFYELIKRVSGTTKNILTERLKLFISKPNQLSFLLVLAYLGEGDVNLFMSLSGCSSYEVDRLIENGWVRYTNGNQVDFYHPSIERFLIEIINHENQNKYLHFIQDQSLTDVIAERLLKSGVEDIYPLARFALSGNDAQFLDAALEAIKTLKDTVPTIRKKMHAQALYEFIIRPNNIPPASYIDAIQAICNLSAEGQVQNMTNRLWTCRQRLNSFTPTTNHAAYALCGIIRQYASYSSLLGKPEIGEQILRDELSKVDLLSGVIDTYTLSKIKVNYMNRRCVCLKGMGDMKLAEEIGKKALEMALQYDHKEFACLILIDLCGIYRSEKKDFEHYSNYVERALSFYEVNRKEINELEPSIEFSCLENKAHLEGLRGNIQVAIRSAEQLIRLTEKSYSHYYMLRGLLAKAVLNCRQQLSETQLDKQDLDLLKEMINEIEDLSIISRIDRFYIKALHLHAILNCHTGNTHGAKALFVAALEKLESDLQKNTKNTYITPSNGALLWDAANFWIEYMIEEPFPIKHYLLRGTNVSDIHKAISNRQVKVPFTLFATESFNYPFP
ncbi:MAG: hypothetical protein CMI36_16440 [Owenweeksia sp.]|nr:hypothetical protein [Micavibrio sp.]MBG00581.1 hypothetical protein [Owenweeksia sp.]|tara:strand:+ start:15 stop:3452 length:3438 start_codon:yes stop_codon:yes gene_type:complete